MCVCVGRYSCHMGEQKRKKIAGEKMRKLQVREKNTRFFFSTDLYKKPFKCFYSFQALMSICSFKSCMFALLHILYALSCNQGQ